MIKYLPLTQLPPEAVSAGIWNLSRPDSEQLATKYYCGWIQHPDTQQYALTLDEDDTQPIHPEADGAIFAFVTVLRPIVGDLEADSLQAQLTDAKGGHVNVLNLLPPSLATNLITPAQAQEGGWFIDPELDI
jgi:hypothetical protein